jgi:hypothetical protein
MLIFFGQQTEGVGRQGVVGTAGGCVGRDAETLRG